MSEQPATDIGSTQPAGEGVSDDQLSEQVAEQTSSDLAVSEEFAQEADGAKSDQEAAEGGTEG